MELQATRSLNDYFLSFIHMICLVSLLSRSTIKSLNNVMSASVPIIVTGRSLKWKVLAGSYPLGLKPGSSRTTDELSKIPFVGSWLKRTVHKNC